MGKWKDSKSGGYYELFLSDSDVAEATLYKESIDGVEMFSVTVSVGGTFYSHKPLAAQTVEEAKQEAKFFIADKYRDAIKQYKASIRLAKAKINELFFIN